MLGIAFPTCVSSNAAICHMSPLSSDPEGSNVLKKGDVVRIELGAHIDGYIAQAAHTVIIGASKVWGTQVSLMYFTKEGGRLIEHLLDLFI